MPRLTFTLDTLSTGRSNQSTDNRSNWIEAYVDADLAKLKPVASAKVLKLAKTFKHQVINANKSLTTKHANSKDGRLTTRLRSEHESLQVAIPAHEALIKAADDKPPVVVQVDVETPVQNTQVKPEPVLTEEVTLPKEAPAPTYQELLEVFSDVPHREQLEMAWAGLNGNEDTKKLAVVEVQLKSKDAEISGMKLAMGKAIDDWSEAAKKAKQTIETMTSSASHARHWETKQQGITHRLNGQISNQQDTINELKKEIKEMAGKLEKSDDESSEKYAYLMKNVKSYFTAQAHLMDMVGVYSASSDDLADLAAKSWVS